MVHTCGVDCEGGPAQSEAHGEGVDSLSFSVDCSPSGVLPIHLGLMSRHRLEANDGLSVNLFGKLGRVVWPDEFLTPRHREIVDEFFEE